MPSEIIELTLDPAYVPSWGVWEGVREFLQNAMDVQDTHPDKATGVGKMEVEWCPHGVSITSKGIVLSRSSLLLGRSTKRGDGVSRGQFGEGYKLACLALLRAGCSVRIYTDAEGWRPFIGESRQFPGERTLQFEVWPVSRTGDTTVLVGGMTTEQVEQCRKRVLFNTPHKILGEAVVPAGQLFVGGLWVADLNDNPMGREHEQKHDFYTYSYNFPKLELDRDRRMASEGALRATVFYVWLESRFSKITPESTTELWTMLQHPEWREARIIADWLYSSSWLDALQAEFFATFGDIAYPVETSSEEEDCTRAGIRAVVLKAPLRDVLRRALPPLQDMIANASTAHTARVHNSLTINETERWEKAKRMVLDAAKESDERLQEIITDRLTIQVVTFYGGASGPLVGETRFDRSGNGKHTISIAARLLEKGQEHHLVSTLAHEVAHLIHPLHDHPQSLLTEEILGRLAVKRVFLGA